MSGVRRKQDRDGAIPVADALVVCKPCRWHEPHQPDCDAPGSKNDRPRRAQSHNSSSNGLHHRIRCRNSRVAHLFSLKATHKGPDVAGGCPLRLSGSTPCAPKHGGGFVPASCRDAEPAVWSSISLDMTNSSATWRAVSAGQITRGSPRTKYKHTAVHYLYPWHWADPIYVVRSSLEACMRALGARMGGI